jgi:hypothetical protein
MMLALGQRASGYPSGMPMRAQFAGQDGQQLPSTDMETGTGTSLKPCYGSYHGLYHPILGLDNKF